MLSPCSRSVVTFFDEAAVMEESSGNGWQDKLLKTACFNIVPFRSPKVDDLSPQTWKLGTQWGLEVLEHIGPELIVCNGNGESKSPWSVIESAYGIGERKVQPIGANASVKEGAIVSGPLKGTRIIGLSSLSYFGRQALYEKLAQLAPFV